MNWPVLFYSTFAQSEHRQNRANRAKRARDPDPEFLASVLAIEHEIIALHRARAAVVLPAPEEELELAEAAGPSR